MTKEVLITGSSRGIGRETALYLAKNGYDIVLHCNKNIAQGEKVLEQVLSLGVRGRLLQFNVADREECKQILTKDVETNGIYYGIVLNAGIARDNIFPIFKDNEWDEVLDTNLGGFYNVLRPLIMPMISKHVQGRIVVMSSVSGLCGNRGQVNYSASKAGLIGASKALSLEIAKRGITVNCIAPGAIESDMTEKLPIEEIKNLIPMKRLGTAKEIASLVNYLMSEDAAYITGQVISVNGGMYR